MIKLIMLSGLKSGGLEVSLNHRLNQIAVENQADVKIIAMSVYRAPAESAAVTRLRNEDIMYILIEVIK